MVACCKKLHKYAKDLEPSLRGKQVIISDGFCLRPDGVMEINWDFSFEEANR